MAAMKRRPSIATPRIISDSDKELFRASVGEVRELATRQADPDRPRRQLEPTASASDPVAAPMAHWRGNVPLQAGDVVRFRAAGVQERVLRRLRQGEPRPEADLDLHGLTGKLALEFLPRFIADAYAVGRRSLLIVHGKGHRSEHGQPKLKTLVCDWLAGCPIVQAFCSARPDDGGTGAVYVLLKAKQDVGAD